MDEVLKNIQKHKRERTMKIGTSKYGGGQQKKYFKLKDGEQTFRILPALGELADDGRWSVFYNVHYGYKNAEGKVRAFQSPEVKNRKSRMIEIPDAANERIANLKAALQKAKDSRDEKGKEALLKLVGGPKSNYNLDSNHYMNVIDEQGNIGVLKLRHRAKQALQTEIDVLRKKGIDPLHPDTGRFFVFRRTGMGLDTSFQVTVKKQLMTVDVGGEKVEVERDLVHVLTPEIISRLDGEAVELGKLFKKPTSEEVAQIVAESNLQTGVSPNIDAILGFNSKGGGKGAPQVEEPSYEDGPDEDDAAQTTPPVSTKTETKVAAPTVDTKVAMKVETKVEAPKATVAASSPQTTASQVSSMSEQEFLASLGLSNN
jgi:hypothetical protein